MSVAEVTAAGPIVVRAGTDRHGGPPGVIWGKFGLTSLLSGDDTNGAIYIFQHANMPKGGPPRHVHPGQDEWFYVIRGTFAFEVGGERFTLGPGDSALAPRGVPHVWACVSDEPGTVITAVTPVGPFERFMHDTTRHATVPTPEALNQAFLDGGMELLGPPLDVP